MSSDAPDKDKAGPRVWKIPPGDDRERLVCEDCGYVQYDNPKVVVGSVPTWEGKILLCRRSIPPRVGFWALPAGYLELRETTADGAAREAWEEARARVEIDDLLAVYNIPRISQVQMYYRAHLTSPDIEAGPESLEVALFDWADIPREEVAFPSVHWALDHWYAVRESATAPVFSNPPGETGNMWRP
ncbi:MAG: NUDIX hydrolase [Pseudomonadota bacterium]